MGSKPSKAEPQSIPVATKTVAIPALSRIPNEIIDEILNHLIASSGPWDKFLPRTLRSFSLVSKSYVPSCRRHLFHTIVFSSRNIVRWLETFPVPEESPACYVKDLWFPLTAPEELFQHIPWFTNVERMTVQDVISPWFGKFFPAKLPQSVTSLTIRAEYINFVRMRDIMAQLPNLNDLTLSGTVLAHESRGLSLELGAGLRGRFGGELEVRDGHTVSKELVDMLLEVPTGLHFTKIYIHAELSDLPQVVRLAEACCKTLVDFSCLCSTYLGGQEPVGRSLDFSKFPRLKTVTLSLRLTQGSLHYIPMALSTLKPSTSPHLSYVHLRLTGPTCHIPHLVSRTSGLENLDNDLRQVADELSRIEREYEGAVELIVLRSSEFELLNRLSVLQHWRLLSPFPFASPKLAILRC